MAPADLPYRTLGLLCRRLSGAVLRRSAFATFVVTPMMASASVTYGAPGCEFVATLPHSFQMQSADVPQVGQLHAATFAFAGYRYRVLCSNYPSIVKSASGLRDFFLGSWAGERLQNPRIDVIPGTGDVQLRLSVSSTRPSANDTLRTEIYEERCLLGASTYMCISAFRDQALPASAETEPMFASIRPARPTSEGRWTLLGNDAGLGDLYIDPRSRHVDSSDSVTVTLLRDLERPVMISVGVLRSIQMQATLSCGAEPQLRLVDYLGFVAGMGQGNALSYSARQFDFPIAAQSPVAQALLAKTCALGIS